MRSQREPVVKKFAPAFLDRMFYLVMSREPDSPFK